MILSAVFWKVEFEEKLDPKKRYIFCPNHSSTLDIPLITAAIPLPLLFMGKKEIAWIICNPFRRYERHVSFSYIY